ncbi:calcium/sodium antiporter [Myxosarcina sp. GI1]|uniref:calcium/sodium antiporter n=1 Tax=Myxosarcina sp. GI1 TaxID=1541065 RepID=UPI000566EBBE|nr:calcium/sodium antiporter [Myxosarcina sp. GI1]
MNLTTILLLVCGFVLLVFGAEFLVKGASRLAIILRIPPLIIGLTIVAYGTSAPEMAVSIIASFAGQSDIAIGNALGSNICNILLILGLSALVAPLIVNRQVIRSDVPIMIGVTVLLLLFGLDGELGRMDGIILFIGALLYTFSLIYQSRKQKDLEADEFTREYGLPSDNSIFTWLKNLAYIIGGSALLVFGSRLLVDSATSIARDFGVSELVIGLTIISFGTSLPELATSVMASFRGERDIAVGNVLGSNIFNILAVLGVAGIVAPNGIEVAETVIEVNAPVAIAVSFACLPIFYSGYRLDRWEGLLFILYYLAYIGYLVMDATNYEGLPVYRIVMLAFVIPITVITLVTIAIRQKQSSRRRKRTR